MPRNDKNRNDQEPSGTAEILRPRDSNSTQKRLYVRFRRDKDGRFVDQFGFGFSRDDARLLPSFRRPATTSDEPTEKIGTPGTDKEDKYGFKEAILAYERQMDAFHAGVPFVSKLLPIMSAVIAERDVRDFAVKNGELIEKTEEDAVEELYALSTDFLEGFLQTLGNVNNLHSFANALPGMSLIGLVSVYDGYLSMLLRCLFSVQRTSLSSTDKTVSLKELLDFDSIEDIRRHVVEKEVESVLRASHLQHFQWLEKRLEIPLREGLSCWSEFLEICERRNIYTHSGGQVSRLYLDNCRELGIKVQDGATIGVKLPVSPKYFRRSIDVFYEVGIKLGHVMWRKLVPEEVESADKNLNHIAYERIQKRNYKLAIKLLEFATKMPGVRDWSKKAMCVNYANALKLDGNKEKSLQVLSGTDWSATSREFRISVAAIRDEFDTAAKLMKEVGSHGEVKKEFYHSWPVFHHFRRTDQFKEMYREVFGVDFVADEIEMEKEEAKAESELSASE